MTHLGIGISPVEKYHYFDRDKYITLGNGDPFYKKSKMVNEIETNNEKLSRFISIFQTLVFFSEPSCSNTVIFENLDMEDFYYLIAELFKDYQFYFVGEGEEKTNLTFIRVLKLDDFKYKNPIYFTGDITGDKEKIIHMDPYLAMGDFQIYKNTTFLDGIVLRPVFSENFKIIIKGIGYRDWDKKNLESLMKHHLLEVRKKIRFYNIITGEENPGKSLEDLNLDNFYDSSSLVFVTLKYLEKINLNNSEIYTLLELILKTTADN